MRCLREGVQCFNVSLFLVTASACVCECVCDSVNTRETATTNSTAVDYCSVVCQKRHWHSHKPRCKNIQFQKEQAETTSTPWPEVPVADGSCTCLFCCADGSICYLGMSFRTRHPCVSVSMQLSVALCCTTKSIHISHTFTVCFRLFSFALSVFWPRLLRQWIEQVLRGLLVRVVRV